MTDADDLIVLRQQAIGLLELLEDFYISTEYLKAELSRCSVEFAPGLEAAKRDSRWRLIAHKEFLTVWNSFDPDDDTGVVKKLLESDLGEPGKLH